MPIEPLFALSDTASIQIATAVLALLSTVFGGVMTYLMARLNAQQKVGQEQRVLGQQQAAAAVEQVRRTAAVAARKVEQVRVTLQAGATDSAGKLDGLVAVAAATHARAEENYLLLNGTRAALLKSNAELCRWKAASTRDPADVLAAEQAERDHAEHAAKLAAAAALSGPLRVVVVNPPGEPVPVTETPEVKP